MKRVERLLPLALALATLLGACGEAGTCVESTSPFVCGEDYTKAECSARHGTWHGSTPCAQLAP